MKKARQQKKVWFYQLNLDRNLGKGNPLSEADLAEFVELQKTKADSANSWSVNIENVDQTTFDLSVKNPNKSGGTVLRRPKDILEEIKNLDKESESILNNIKASVTKNSS